MKHLRRQIPLLVLGAIAFFLLSAEHVKGAYQTREELKDCQIIANAAIEKVGIAKLLK